MSTVISRVQATEKPKSYFTTHIRPMLRQWPVRLLLVLLLAELFLPIIIYMTPVPASAAYFIEIMAALIMLLTLFFMLARDRIPAVMLVVLGTTLVWGLVALFEGQGLAATAWGWWKFFMYPFVGLFAYLTVRWPPGFAAWMLKVLIILMAFEVGVQIIQSIFEIGFIDDRAGTFAQNGVGPQNMFNWLVISLALGAWISQRRWKPLLIAVVLGLAASILNGTKFYVPSIVLLGIATLGLQLISGGHLKQLFVFGALFAILAAASLPIYNYFVAEARGARRLQEYFEPARLEEYLFNDGNGALDGKYNLGRMLSVTYGFDLISRDPTTFLFGMGLGARSNSAGLGIVGIGLQNDLYTKAQGTGLLTRIQEQGVVGLAAMWLFFIWIMWQLYRDTKVHNDGNFKSLEYGLIIFTFFLPLWFWYTNPWFYGVTMILYLCSLGYVFSSIHRREQRTKHGREQAARLGRRRSKRARTPSSIISPDIDQTQTSRNGQH